MIDDKCVILHDNMLDENELVCFVAGIPYLIEEDSIYNGDEMIVELSDIWVEYHVQVAATLK